MKLFNLLINAQLYQDKRIGKIYKMNPYARHKARFYAVQAIYQWQLATTDLATLLVQFLTHERAEKIDKNYFQEIVQTIVDNYEAFDAKFAPYLDRKQSEVSPVELAILRVGTYELVNRIDVPYRVVINEALELAKTFGGVNSHKFVNSVLDQVAKSERVEYE